ncbi:hypothetical protein ACFQXA_17675 [Nocardiopsis composta]
MSRERDLLLELLRERYGERWAIRRSEHLWIATANDPDADHAPTLVQPDLDTFVGELEAPRPGPEGRAVPSWRRACSPRTSSG